MRVSAGGQILKEGVDYEIDYNIGRIKILNDAYLNSGVPIQASFEDNAVFGQQNRSMIGLRADYEVSRELSVGGTFMHMRERPFSQKVNVGDDPINNRIFGIDMLYGADAPWLTRAVDKLPGISTREPSSINFSAEAAFLQPGHSKAIGKDEGTVYIDDFEGSASGFDLKTPINRWRLASVPQGQPALFPEATGTLVSRTDSFRLQANRALINWYRLDVGGRLRADDPYTYQVNPQDLYPLRQNNPFSANNFLFTFDITYDPSERGPYNFDVPGGYSTSAGLSRLGRLDSPGDALGGIMRDLTTNDFQAANIEYLEFWMLSPFLEGRNQPVNEGDLYIEFGNISEDVIRDSRLFFENGLPAGEPGSPNRNRPTDKTTYGFVPRLAPIVQAFDNEPANRVQQDLGYDGADDATERVIFANWLAAIRAGVNADVVAQIEQDPSNDNFETFRGQTNSNGVLNHRRFNGPQGNSPINPGEGLAVNSTNLPDSEDVNGDNTLSETESYFQYKIPLRSSGVGGDRPGRRALHHAGAPHRRRRVPGDRPRRRSGTASRCRSTSPTRPSARFRTSARFASCGCTSRVFSGRSISGSRGSTLSATRVAPLPPAPTRSATRDPSSRSPTAPCSSTWTPSTSRRTPGANRLRTSSPRASSASSRSTPPVASAERAGRRWYRWATSPTGARDAIIRSSTSTCGSTTGSRCLPTPRSTAATATSRSRPSCSRMAT